MNDDIIIVGGNSDAAKPQKSKYVADANYIGKTSRIVGKSEIPITNYPLNGKCPCGSGKKYKRCHYGKGIPGPTPLVAKKK